MQVISTKTTIFIHAVQNCPSRHVFTSKLHPEKAESNLRHLAPNKCVDLPHLADLQAWASISPGRDRKPLPQPSTAHVRTVLRPRAAPMAGRAHTLRTGPKPWPPRLRAHCQPTPTVGIDSIVSTTDAPTQGPRYSLRRR